MCVPNRFQSGDRPAVAELVDEVAWELGGGERVD
jgi:hypothetical protein